MKNDKDLDKRVVCEIEGEELTGGLLMKPCDESYMAGELVKCPINVYRSCLYIIQFNAEKEYKEAMNYRNEQKRKKLDKMFDDVFEVSE